MKIKRILCLLPVLVLLWVGPPVRVYAETAEIAEATESPETASGSRNIYVGDIITLKITSRDFSPDDLREKFKAFEIVEIKDEPDGYVLSLRTFETGEKKILLGDKEISINVQSTLDDIQREGIFEGAATVMESGFPFHWRILFYVAAGIFILSGCIVLVRAFLKRKIKALSPYRMFLMRSSSLSAEDESYFVDLTFYFKEYIESLYKCRIIGKTSVEIVKELNRLQALDTMLPEIQKWLTECDRFKFTGMSVSKEIKQAHYGELLKLAENIDNTLKNEGAA